MTQELDQHTKNMIVKLDGWSNVFTGLGRKGKDKRTGYYAEWSRMDWETAENVYACDDIAEKIVDAPVDEAFRKDVIFKKKDMDGDFNKEVWDFLNSIKFFDYFTKAAKWGRMYGGGFLIFGIADGNDPSEEVDFERIRSVEWLNKLHRWDMNAVSINHDVSSEFFRDPERYVFTRGSLSTSELAGPHIHRSRVVRLEGARLPERLYRSNNYFNDSVLNRVQNAIGNYNSSHDSLAVLLQDFSAGVFKMKNLAQLIGAGQDDAVMKRLSLIDLKRSLVKSVVVDADEDFERKATPLSGIKDALQKIDDRLVAASKMPHTLLLGEGTSGGLNNGEGGAEQEQWDDYIKGLQKSEFKPALMECMKILLSAKDNPVTKGIIPEGFDISFPPLNEPSQKEKADVYKTTAEADAIYINSQVLDPNEVAISRFSDDEFNQDTQIDTELREEKLEEGEEPDMEDDLPPEPTPPNDDPNGRQDGFIQDHYHEFGPQIHTGGIVMKDDGTHTHVYWVSGVRYETNPAPTGQAHNHELMHREGETGKAIPCLTEIRIDGIEKDGSMFVLKDGEGQKVLGKFKSKKKALDAMKKYDDEYESNVAKRKKGPELLPKDD